MISQASHSHDRFATTRWSMVMQFADTDAPLALNALGELIQRYWYPVYAYVRRCDHAPATAERITRALLLRLLHDSGPAQQATASPHYRRFLLDRIRTFLGADWQQECSGDSGSIELVAPIDLEKRYLHDHPAASSPEQAFQRSFALVVLQRTLKRLRSEAADTGHAAMCRALEPFLANDPSSIDYERIAHQLGTRRMTLILALKRLRQRLRELAAQELSDTVSSAENLASEQDALVAILGELA
jgi:RNA polymerase sigma-70 factor (ECF subfamily)